MCPATSMRRSFAIYCSANMLNHGICVECSMDIYQLLLSNLLKSSDISLSCLATLVSSTFFEHLYSLWAYLIHLRRKKDNNILSSKTTAVRYCPFPFTCCNRSLHQRLLYEFIQSLRQKDHFKYDRNISFTSCEVLVYATKHFYQSSR